MNELIELDRKVRQHFGRELDDAIVLAPTDEPQELMDLPGGLRLEIEMLRGELGRIVPDDFSYAVSLGDGLPDLMVVYHDGPQTMTGCPHDWQPDRSILEQLRSVDWDSDRQGALSRCQLADGLVAEGAVRSPQIPSTEKLQKLFRRELKAFAAGYRKGAPGVHVLMCSEDEGFREERYAGMPEFSSELPDLMTVGFLVIGVVSQGRLLTVAAIEELKKTALKELEDMPISHARASHKF